MSTSAELFTIGQLARRTGVAARTIRFWSDAGLVPPAARSGSGYRLYDADAVARLDLVRTLRELGLGLDVVQAVLARARTVAEVAAAHVTVLDAQIRTLRLRRAVLSTVARGGHTIEETLVMHKLARLSAQERQQIIDDFVDDVFQGTGPDAPEGKAILDRIVAPGTPAAQRARLLEQLETFTDARVERYWQLLAIINGQPVPPSVVPGFEWLIAALRADLGS
jgi:DNA-binding transcriptional MerR regulator